MPLAATRYPNAARIESLGDRAMRGRANRFNLPDDRQDLRGESVRLVSLSGGAVGARLGEITGVAELFTPWDF